LTDKVLMRGDFDFTDSIHIPRIPGYDLDINDDVNENSR